MSRSVPPAEDSGGVNSMPWFCALILVVREVCFVILVSLTTVMSNAVFLNLSRWSRSSEILHIDHALISNKVKDLRSSGNF